MNPLKLEVIGRIETPFRERFGTPRQPGLIAAAQGRITFEKEFRNLDYFRGIEEFSHLWLTFVFDRVMGEYVRPLVRPPRLGGNTKVGVFASRSPYRPNHLGLSCVAFESLELTNDGPLLKVSGVDLTSGTPIVDIRPYISYSDCVPQATCGFAEPGAPRRLPVKVSPGARDSWVALLAGQRELIEQTLAHDPVPAFHNDPARIYRLEISKVHVEWQKSAQGVEIVHVSSVDDSDVHD